MMMVQEFFLLYLPLLKVIPETKLISWLKEISLEKLFFESGTFSEILVFKEIYFSEGTSLFHKSLLSLLVFVNYEGPCQEISS